MRKERCTKNHLLEVTQLVSRREGGVNPGLGSRTLGAEPLPWSHPAVVLGRTVMQQMCISPSSAFLVLSS